MEVVNEADAPELPPAATPHEGEEAAAAPSLLDAPAPPPPETMPVDPALPASTKEAEDEASAFQRPTLRAVLAERLWAGMLGGGAWAWSAGMLGALASMDLVPRLGDGLIVLAFVPATVVVLARGFRAPVRSYANLAGRLLGALFFGVLWSALVGLIVVLLGSALHFRDFGTFIALALVGAPMSGLALARIHGIPAEKPRRLRIAAGFAAVIFVSCWPALPSLRCRLGFAQGCRAAAESSWDEGDYRAAGELGARGCQDEDSFSCRLAGQAYQHDAPTRDLRLAEGFFNEGCSLGDPTSCARVHGIELARRCDRNSVSACTELARAHLSGEGAEQDQELGKRYYRKACLLGSEGACWTVEYNHWK
jgi:hypothetical protein